MVSIVVFDPTKEGSTLQEHVYMAFGAKQTLGYFDGIVSPYCDKLVKHVLKETRECDVFLP
jgi:hypothetical protein